MTVEEDEDPLDAFMKDISSQAVAQDHFELSKPSKPANVITFEDLQALEETDYKQNELLTNEEEDFISKKEKDPVYMMDKAQEKERKREAKKDLKQDRSGNDEMKINKNLYIESNEITKMTPEEVAKYRKSNGDIKVRGINCPKPLKNWY